MVYYLVKGVMHGILPGKGCRGECGLVDERVNSLGGSGSDFGGGMIGTISWKGSTTRWGGLKRKLKESCWYIKIRHECSQIISQQFLHSLFLPCLTTILGRALDGNLFCIHCIVG